MAFWQRLDHGTRYMIPALLTALLMVLALAPVPLPGYGPVAPKLPLLAIYYWALYRPNLLPPTFAFLVGIVMDLATAGPLGLNAMLFVAARWVVAGQRRYILGESFLVTWAGFLTLALISAVIEWLIVSMFQVAFLPLTPALFGALILVGLYPPLERLLTWILRHVLLHVGS